MLLPVLSPASRLLRGRPSHLFGRPAAWLGACLLNGWLFFLIRPDLTKRDLPDLPTGLPIYRLVNSSSLDFGRD